MFEVATSAAKQVAVIIVSYNTVDLLRRAIQSVYQAASASRIVGDDLRVVVVDNASGDGSAEMVAEKFPQATLLALADNIGFAKANNLALNELGFRSQPTAERPQVTPPDYVMLLNPDAELDAVALQRMAMFLDDCPAAGACGARLLYGDGTFQHSAFKFPTLAQVALDLLPLSGIRGAGRIYDSRFNGRYPQEWWQKANPFQVDFVLGAAMMIRGEAIQQIGGLDEGYFMYCEEMDWCLRLREAGWKVYAVPTAHVIHYEAQSSSQTPWTSFNRLWRSRIRFYSKHRKHYAPGHLLLVRTLLRNALRYRAWMAKRRFAKGQITGRALANELDAYATVARL